MKKKSEMRAGARTRPGSEPLLGPPVFLARDDMPAPSLEEARRRIWSRRGFFSSISDETWSILESFDHPEVVGPADDSCG